MNHFEVDAQTAAIRRRDFIKLGAGASVMMALDPLGASAQSTASRPISIDLHTHWVPEAYDKALAQLKRPTPASTNPLDFDLDKRRKWMDEHGVQMHVLLRLRKLCQRLERIQQRMLAGFGEAQLPQQDVRAAGEAMQ